MDISVEVFMLSILSRFPADSQPVRYATVWISIEFMLKVEFFTIFKAALAL